jgi:hypothetical protein
MARPTLLNSRALKQHLKGVPLDACFTILFPGAKLPKQMILEK